MGTLFDEDFQSKVVGTADVWEDWDLSGFGVGDGDTVEIDIWVGIQTASSTVGCRTNGTSIERKVTIHESEGGRANHVRMTCTADSSGIIEVVASHTVYDEAIFYYMGIWGGGEYVQITPAVYNSTTDNDWETNAISEIVASKMVEVFCANMEVGIERNGGVRAIGSSLARYFDNHEAEPTGDYSGVTLNVMADSSKQIQLFAEVAASYDFVILGYWNTPPGIWTEKMYMIPANTTTDWEDEDLSSEIIDGAVVELVGGSNRSNGAELVCGWRENGSSVGRNILMGEAEAGGYCLTSGHIESDVDGIVELRAGNVTNIRHWVTGYWEIATAIIPLAGSLGATSNVPNATLKRNIKLNPSFGAVTCLTTVNGVVKVFRKIAGIVDGQSNVPATTLSRSMKLVSVAIIGQSNVPDAPMGIFVMFAGIIDGQSNVPAATMKVSRKLIGTVTALGSGLDNSPLKVSRKLIGSSDGLSTVDGIMKRTRGLTGTVDGLGAAEAILKVARKLIGSVGGQATVIASLTITGAPGQIVSLIGSVSVQSTVSGHLRFTIQEPVVLIVTDPSKYLSVVSTIKHLVPVDIVKTLEVRPR